MNTHLSNELYWLSLTLLMTVLLWVPYIINRLLEHGIGPALWDPQGNTDTNRAWAKRMMQAHQNAIENLAIFAPLVLIVQFTGINSEATANACMIYFFARLAHYIVFTFAVPVLRIVSFLVAVAAQLSLLVHILQS